MIVVDASVLIAHLAPDQFDAERAANILDTEDALIMHPLTVAECAVGPARVGELAVFQRAITRLGLDVWQPDSAHAYRVATLRATSPLKLPDCCVLDAARTLSASLATFDEQLAKVARSLGILVEDGNSDA